MDTLICSDAGVKRKRGSKRGKLWQPAAPGPKSCPKAIIKYTLTHSRREHSLLEDVRRHLYYLGWKIEYLKDRLSPGGLFRYTSPDGKLYLSLRQICLELRASTVEIKSESSQDEHNSLPASPDDDKVSSPEEPEDSSSDTLALQPEYCHEAVVYWYEHGIEKKRKSNAYMILKAKKHLLAVGWSFWYKAKGLRQELRYTSPSGTVYYSLRAACKGCIDEGAVGEGINSIKKSSSSTKPEENSVPSNTKLPLTPLSNSSKRRKKDDLLDFGSHSLQNVANSHAIEDGPTAGLEGDGLRHQAEDKSVIISEPKSGKRKRTSDDRERTQRTHVLQSSKRARPEVLPSVSNRNPRTVLSWLIDNSVVSPRAKVHYLGAKGPLAKGQIDRDGITCDCCSEVFTLSGFEAHAGSKKHRPAANIFLEDGRSLLHCQRKIVGNHIMRRSTKKQHNTINGNSLRRESDQICSFCYYGGELILCDNCPSAFHMTCLDLKDVPHGDWFCPSCCCGICGKSKYEENVENSQDDDIVCICDQCQDKFHLGCIRKSREVVKFKNYTQNKWFCSDRCEHVSSGLHELLGRPFLLGVDNLTWRLLKTMEADQHDPSDSHEMEVLMENQSKLNVALDVMHECFEPVKEAFTGRDLVEDVIFNRRSNLNRLNFRGFYTVLLEKNEEVISVATVRVYEKVAEIPLIATRFRYRRKGMCSLLMNELESHLAKLGVERLILPSVSDMLKTWTTKFGFSKMTDSEKLQYLDCTFLNFQGTTMCHKPLTKTTSANL